MKTRRRRRQLVLSSGLLLGMAILIVSTRLNMCKMVRIMEQQRAAVSFQTNSTSSSSSASMHAAAKAARDILSRHHSQNQDMDDKQPALLQAVALLDRKRTLTITNGLNETTTSSLLEQKKPLQQKPQLSRQKFLQQLLQQQAKLHLEFVHIPKTGGSAIESAAKKKNIRWGAFHYNQNRIPKRRRFQDVPYWHLPPSYYDSHDPKSTFKNCNFTTFCYDPYGPNPYKPKGKNPNNTRLFTIVRDPYARVVSEYLFYHREIMKRYAKLSKLEWYNDAHNMNVWLAVRLNLMRRTLTSTSAHRQIQKHAQARFEYMNNNRNNNNKWNNKNVTTMITLNGNSTTFTRTVAAAANTKTGVVQQATFDIADTHPNVVNNDTKLLLPPMLMNTADEWRNWPYQTKLFRKAYYAHLGHFIPQYDYVYNGFSTMPTIHHVLHFENLHAEFAALMKLYQLPIVLPMPKSHHDKNNSNSTSTTQSATDGVGPAKAKINNSNSFATTAAIARTLATTSIIKDTTQQQPINLVGVQNLTEANRRLIELIYARDFLAFGYQMMPPIVATTTTTTTTAADGKAASTGPASNAAAAARPQ